MEFHRKEWGVRPAGWFSDRSGFGGFSRVILSYLKAVTQKGAGVLLSPLTRSVFFQEHRGKGSTGMISLPGHWCCFGHWVRPGGILFPIPSFPDHCGHSVLREVTVAGGGGGMSTSRGQRCGKGGDGIKFHKIPGWLLHTRYFLSSYSD